MKMFRYRAPSMKTVLGVTAAERRVKRSLGISQVQAWTKPSRMRDVHGRAIARLIRAIRRVGKRMNPGAGSVTRLDHYFGIPD
jgi:hypothetical protein